MILTIDICMLLYLNIYFNNDHINESLTLVHEYDEPIEKITVKLIFKIKRSKD